MKTRVIEFDEAVLKSYKDYYFHLITFILLSTYNIVGKPLKVIFKINCHLRFVAPTVDTIVFFFLFCGHFKLNPFEIAQFTFPIIFLLLPRYTTPLYDILFLFRWDLFQSKSLSCRHTHTAFCDMSRRRVLLSFSWLPTSCRIRAINKTF